jgi:pro-apoptotic serine protease NMA111
VDTELSSQCGSGVLVAEDGTVEALWLTHLGQRSQKNIEYHLGLGTLALLPVIEKIQNGIIPRLRMLGVELNDIQMSQARIMGVSEEWINKVDNLAHHQLFTVRRRTCDQGDESGVLLEGDVILSLNDKIVTQVSDLDVMYNHEVLDAVIVRDRLEMRLKVLTISADGLETDRVVLFCGLIFHRPHLAVRQQISKLHSEVYVSSRIRGSPSYQYGLCLTNFITHVNDISTPNLEMFIKEIIKIPDNTCKYNHAYILIFLMLMLFRLPTQSSHA